MIARKGHEEHRHQEEPSIQKHKRYIGAIHVYRAEFPNLYHHVESYKLHHDFALSHIFTPSSTLSSDLWEDKGQRMRAGRSRRWRDLRFGFRSVFPIRFRDDIDLMFSLC
ncbi:hypothetical protein KC322_g57 [Hortaea werneckii]|nr:hypothetical protein KC322_g57 [Hortaea werneckii]